MPRFQFVFDICKPAFNFLVESRPRLQFDFGAPILHSCCPTNVVQQIQFITEQRPHVCFDIGIDNRHSCGEMNLGFRFMDSFIVPSFDWHVLYLHSDVTEDSIKRYVSVIYNGLDVELVHGSYRDIELGDWDNSKLLDIDPEIIGMKVLGKIRVNIDTNYPDTWLLLADKDGKILSSNEDVVFAVERQGGN